MSSITLNRPMATAARRREQLAGAQRLGVCAAAGISLAAAWVHFVYVADHWRDWWAYGLTFVAMGVFQAVLALAIMRWPNRWIALGGVAGNLAIVSMYVLSRTSGIPLGPHTGVVERATLIDLATTAGEIALIGILVTMVGAFSRRLILNAMLIAAVVVWILRATERLA